MMKLRKNQKGFTLIEVLLIVVILGIIAAIAIPRLMASRQEAQLQSCRANVANINTAIEKYYLDYGFYPADLDGTTATVAATADAAGTAGSLFIATFLFNGVAEPYFPDGAPLCGAGGAYAMNANHRAFCSVTTHGDINGL